jgi:4-coumarate--CoA ligase
LPKRFDKRQDQVSRLIEGDPVNRSPFPPETIPDQSVFDFLFEGLTAEDASRTAITDGSTAVALSYGELREGIERMSGALAARQLGVGDVIAVHAPNVPAFAIVFHGILRSGATATTINVLYTASEVAAQLRDAGARALFTVSALLATAREAAAVVGIPDELVFVIDGAEGHPSLAALLGEKRVAPVVDVDPATHVAVMPYSSGTTGVPKGVQLSHRNLVANVVQCRPALDVVEDDVVLAVLPFFHIYGMTVLLNIALKSRARLVTMPRFDLPEFLRIIQDERCTYLFIAPPIAVALAKHPLIAEFDLTSVRAVLSGAAPLDESLAHAVEARLGTRVRQGYGMTELSPVSHIIPGDRNDIPLGTIGVPIANVECRLLDPTTGSEIPQPAQGWSEPGELCVRGPNVMIGYLGQPEATSEIIDGDGFLHTGDLARVDSGGVFVIVDRLKELIKYHGYQVAPAELEAVLLTHPAIADAAVIGVLDAEGDEIPKAFVVPVAGTDLTPDDVIAYVADRVSAHKKVRAVEFIELIPKSSAGKILRKELRALAPRPDGTDSQA